MRLRKRKDFEGRFPTDGISRPIGDLKRFPAFDGLRAFAAIAVVGVHTAFSSGFSKRSGFAIYTARLEIGVSVFFVISGFLLYRPFAAAHLEGRAAPETLKFWVRRLFRIVPAYWLAVTIIVFVLHDAVIPSGLRGALVHYSFLQIYFPSQIFFGVGPAWSLCTEMSFYLFLPLYAMAMAFRRRDSARQFRWELCGLATLVAISYAFRIWSLSRHWSCAGNCFLRPAVSSTMTAWLPSYLDLFAIGMGLAVLSAWFTARSSEPAWLRHRAMPWVSWGIALVAFYCVSHLGIDPQPIYSATPATNILKQTLYGVFALALVAPAVFGPQDAGAIRRALRFAPVAWLGVVSYGIYLWHPALTEQIFKWTGRQEFGIPFGVLFLSVVALSVVVASISYLVMEQPLLEFANRLTRRKAYAEAVAAEGWVAASGEPRRVVGSPVTVPSIWSAGAHLRTKALDLRWRAWRASFGSTWFLPALLGVTAVAIGVRVGFAAGWTFGRPLPGDAQFFHQAAANLAAGQGFSVASYIPPHHVLPTAEHPPLFSTLLASFDLLGFHSVDAQRILMGIVASLGVFLTGLVGHRVAGPSVGLTAAGIAALDPLWFQTSAVLMSESIYLVVIPAVLLIALSCHDHPRPWRFVLLGGAIALAVLTRSDALSLAVFLGVPVVLYAARSGRRRLTLARCLFAGLVLVLAPWVVRNEIQLGGFALSDNQGGTLAGSYCAPAMNPGNQEYGDFDALCAEGAAGYLIQAAPPPNNATSWNELTISNALTSSTEPYIRGHLGALPGLALARVENTFGLARTSQQVYDGAIEGRIPSFERFGLELGRVLLLFEVIGAIVLARRSRQRFFVLLAPLLAVVFNVSLFYGTTRFLALALPALAVFAAIGLSTTVSLVVSGLRGRRAARSSEDRTDHAKPDEELRPLAGAAMAESTAASASTAGTETPV